MPIKTQAEKQRAMLEERHRIDATIAVIDAAKRKAIAQREEYGKFLRWKVSMQHRERTQREAEERDLRARIDARLKAVLEEHRERKAEEVQRWKDFAQERAPKLRESSGALAARLQQQAEDDAKLEERERKKAAIQARLRATPHSAPSGAGNGAGQDGATRGGRRGNQANATNTTNMTQTGYHPAVPRQGGPPTVGGGGGNSPPKEDAPMFASESDFAAAFPLPDLPRSSSSEQQQQLVQARAGAGGLEALTVAQAKAIEAIDADRKRIARNGRLVSDMYEVAKSRKLYSTARVMADPPADFMIGADLMRYIPADVMGTVDRGAAPKPQTSTRNDAQAFFITENNQAGEGPGALSSTFDETDPQQQHKEGGGGGGAHSPRRPAGGAGGGGGGRLSRWKTYDPNAWMAQKLGATAETLQGGVATLDEAPRNRDEEKATLQWYKECYEPITNIKKRTDRHQTHSWAGVPCHKLPPLPAAKFID